MLYLTIEEVMLLIISVSSLTLMTYKAFKRRNIRYKRCTFISAD